MSTHWESVDEWESAQTIENEPVQEERTTNVGSYHCKSALRCHTSNMKLFLYRKSFNFLQTVTGSSEYTEESLLLLPDLWNCFFETTHGLDRILSCHTSKAHSTGSYALIRWAGHTLSEILSGNILDTTLLSEAPIWTKIPSWLPDFQKSIYQPMIASTRRVLYLTYFLNLTLLVLNYRRNINRPDIKVEIPGIVNEVDEDCYDVVFNEYFKVTIYMDGVRVQTPIYDQILQKDVYLNLCDKINERLNVIWGSGVVSRIACFSKESVDNSDILLYPTVQKIIRWGDDLLYAASNSAFDIIGKYEAYCVSAILRADNPMIWDNEEFQRNLLKDDLQNQPSMYNHAKALCSLINPLAAPLLAEIHGLWRIWGHPIIDLEGGMLKMEATCLKKQNVDIKETAIGVRTFKLTFVKNYYGKHSHYPLCNMSSQLAFDAYRDHLQLRDIEVYDLLSSEYRPESYIHRCIREDKRLDEKDSHYAHEDWDQVVFLQNFQTPQSINLATMIKDKAISQTRTELISSIVSRNSVFDPKKRRGVLKWLTEQTIRLKDYLVGVDKDGLSDDDRIIGLYPKERELKRKARFFSLMSYNMRMYITATEEILGKYLLPYFPMITMSDTLLNMMIRLFNMTTNIGASHSTVTYSMNIDFSKWNQNMREKTNDGIFKSIDTLIGFRALISRTHNIFKTSYLYLCSGEYVPTIIKGMLTAVSPYSRIGDESGKEGLRQKGWTITTVCDIVSLAFLHGVKIELIGGGDNQVLTVEIRSQGRNQNLSAEEQMGKIRERMNRFRNALAKKMDKRGLPLKLEETWISHRLLMYNKIMYLDGVPLPGRMKVISRLFSNSNEGISTLSNITSTLGTGFQALSSKDYDPTYAWLMSRIILLFNLGQYHMFSPVAGSRRIDQQIHLTRERSKEGLTPFGADNHNSRPIKMKEMTRFSGSHTLSFEELYVICIYYHKILGGPGIGTPLSYIMKGFPDPLSEALAFNYKVLGSLKPTSVRFKMIDNITAVNKSPVMHWEHLLEDPVSVNHDVPTHGVAALRAQAEQIVKNATIENKQFKELISVGDTEYLRELSDALCTPYDIEPRLLHDITGATVPGYVNTILSKVDQSSTISKLAANVDIISSVYESEVMYYIFLATKIKIKVGHVRTVCPTQDARSLRNSTWCKNIIGVTTPHPISFLAYQYHAGSSHECDQNYISVLIRRPQNHQKVCRGQFRPYFGSYTAEKFKTGVLASAYGDEDLLKRSLKIQKLLGWRYTKGTNMYTLIQSILSCVTDASPDKFLPTVEEITGDVEHRYHDMATKHGGIPTNLIKHYTYASCNTTTFIDHSKGAANETLHFQAAIIYCTMMSTLMTLDDDVCTKVFHFHEVCRDCIQKTVQSDHEGESLPNLALASCPYNELMYIHEKDIPVHYHNHVAFLRAQKKKTILSSTDSNIITFTEPKERASWLLLVASILAESKPTMKISSIKLTLESMDSTELIYAIKAMVYVQLIKKKKPTSCYDLCDIEDVCRDHEKVLWEIKNTRVMSAYLDDNGTIGSLIGVPAHKMVYEILQHQTDVVDQCIKNAVGKYQDPEFKNALLLMLVAHNPSLKTCVVCAESAAWFIQGKSMAACMLHGELTRDFQYHLYSLDKLSRFKGPSLVSDTALFSRKRKQPTLFDSIKMARTNWNKRQARTRLSGFLYRTLSYETDLTEYMCIAWSRMVVSSPGSEPSDRLHSGMSMSIVHTQEDTVPNDVGSVLRLTQCLMFVISSLISRRGTGSEVSDDFITISVEIDTTAESVAVMRKSLVMLSTMLISITKITVVINFIVVKIESLEDVRLFYLTELAASCTRMMGKTGQIRIKDNGDGQVDIVNSTKDVDAVIAMTTTIVKFLSGQQVFIITDGDLAYNVASRAETEDGGSVLPYQWAILQPTLSVVHPAPLILHGKIGNGPLYISDALVLKSLGEMAPMTDRALCTNIMDSSICTETSSLYSVLYHTLVPLRTGITTESMYNVVVSKLGSGLHEFAMRSSPSEPLPWRCAALVRMILAVRIITDKDTAGAMRYYVPLASISYKRGTYRTVLLHKRNTGHHQHGKLINWTPNSLGDNLLRTVSDMRRWLFVSWHADHVRSDAIKI